MRRVRLHWAVNMRILGDRPAAVVNLDPANDTLPYECAVDVCDLICMTDVAEAFDLGPNGGVVRVNRVAIGFVLPASSPLRVVQGSSTAWSSWKQT